MPRLFFEPATPVWFEEEPERDHKAEEESRSRTAQAKQIGVNRGAVEQATAITVEPQPMARLFSEPVTPVC